MSVADELVATDAERRALAELREASGEVDGVMERHCVRCFYLCELLAERSGRELDREVALCAAILHDIGLYPAVSDGGVYTEEGAALARRVGEEAGWDSERVKLCADACEHHHSLRSKWDLGTEVETLRLADRIEVTGGLVRSGLRRAELRTVAARAPRKGFYRGLVKVVWPVLRTRPATLPKVFRG